MALPSPRLDDREFQHLVDDAKRHVMRRCPEWTDHNIADPGVTLIETFAYMTDQLVYRLNRVPDRLYVRFLDLIGLRMLPPTAASVPVTFWLSAPPEGVFTVPAQTRVSTFRSDTSESVVFATVTDLTLPACALTALATRAAEEEEPTDHSSGLEFGTTVRAFSARPVPGDTLLLGLDTAAPGAAVRLDFAGASEGVGVNPRRPPLVWEAGTAGGWEPCEVEIDETGGLNTDGAIVLHVPPGHENTVLGGMARGWVRARVIEPEEGQPPYSASPVVHRLGASTVGGTVTATHAEIVTAEMLGETEGVPGSRFSLSRGPVLAAELTRLEVSSPEGWLEWTLVEHFGQSGPRDRHAVLDASSGELAFGPLVRQPDGSARQHGAVPGRGETVRITYAVGGGRTGNVTAGAIATLRSSIPYVTSVVNRVSAQGGTDGETLDEAKERGPLMLRSRSRAVTAEDYEVLARGAAPEAARVRAVAADGEGVPPGSVKILVVPAAPNERGRVRLDDLIPGEQTLTRMAERLEQTRVLGSRVHLEPPRYRGVTVVARLIARPAADPVRVREDALDALYMLLNPLPGGGPDGAGWPFGRPVQLGQLHAVLQGIQGVELVEEIRLFSADPVTGRRGGEVTRVEVDKHSLVFSFEHKVRVETN